MRKIKYDKFLYDLVKYIGLFVDFILWLNKVTYIKSRYEQKTNKNILIIFNIKKYPNFL